MPKGACQAKIPLPLRSLYEQPFDLDLGFAKISLSQNYGSSVARQRQLLRDLAARAVKRITNAPRPRAGFSVPNLVKCSAVNPASLQQRERAVFDFNGCVRTYVNVRAPFARKLKGAELRQRILLRNFEKGLLVSSPADQRVEFIRWDQIEEVTKPSPRFADES
jgi:hypothetical protein